MPAQRRIADAIAAALLAMATNATALDLPATSAREIDALLAKLGDSGCRFQRNGSWHAAAEARGHVERKYRYLLDRRQVGSAEDFITLAASKSSISGESYRVRCGDAPPVPSAEWLGTELVRLRAGARP